MGSRLMLNLREAYYLPAATEFVGGETNYYDNRFNLTDIPRPRESTFRVRNMGRPGGGSFDDELPGGGSPGHEQTGARSEDTHAITRYISPMDLEKGDRSIESSARGGSTRSEQSGNNGDSSREILWDNANGKH
jgi:hypothetical protein